MVKHIAGKPKLRLIPRKAMEAMAKVREYGIEKYKGDNYHGVDHIEFVDAALRHLYKHLDGEIIDDESGLDHLWHACCSLALSIAVYKKKSPEDGR